MLDYSSLFHRKTIHFVSPSVPPPRIRSPTTNLSLLRASPKSARGTHRQRRGRGGGEGRLWVGQRHDKPRTTNCCTLGRKTNRHRDGKGTRRSACRRFFPGITSDQRRALGTSAPSRPRAPRPLEDPTRRRLARGMAVAFLTPLPPAASSRASACIGRQRDKEKEKESEII